MSISSFIDQYYLEPIRLDSGYNIVNTITYGLIAIVVVYLLYKYIEKLNIEVDFRFFVSIIPFIFLGSFTRALVDHDVFGLGFWTVSPGIYFVIIGLLVLFLAVCNSFWKAEYWKYLLSIGMALAVIEFVFVFNKLEPANLKFGLIVIGLAALASAALFAAFIFLKQTWATQQLAFAPFFAHLLDASSTFVAVDFLGYWEKHPLPRFAIGIADTAAVQYLLKLAVLIPAVYLITKDIEDKRLRGTLLVGIAALGLAQGLRNLITMVIA